MNPVRKALSEGRPTFGLSTKVPTAVGSEILGRAGFDWVTVDAQHGVVSTAEVVSSIQALELTGTPAFVRVRWNDPHAIMIALDCGASGVVVPMVSTQEEAAAAAAATRYPPDGIRSWGPIRPVAMEERDPLCIVMIETVEALANLDAIAATPGVDALLVGPADLAQSMGLWSGPTTIDGKVMDAIDRVIEACVRNGAIPASSSLGPDYTTELVRRGIQLVTVAGDTQYLAQGAKQDAARIDGWAAEYRAKGVVSNG